ITVVFKAPPLLEHLSDDQLQRLPARERDAILAREASQRSQELNVRQYLRTLKEQEKDLPNIHVYLDYRTDDDVMNEALSVVDKLIEKCCLPRRSRISFPGWPYPGLTEFTEAHTDIFKGRGDKIAEAIGALHAGKRLIAIVGPSGAGKTSFMKAGIVGTIKL